MTHRQPVEDDIDAIVTRHVADLESRSDVRGVMASTVVLSAGAAVWVDHTDAGFGYAREFALYLFSDASNHFYLDLNSAFRLDDDWLSIAETFEFRSPEATPRCPKTSGPLVVAWQRCQLRVRHDDPRPKSCWPGVQPAKPSTICPSCGGSRRDLSRLRSTRCSTSISPTLASTSTSTSHSTRATGVSWRPRTSPRTRMMSGSGTRRRRP